MLLLMTDSGCTAAAVATASAEEDSSRAADPADEMAGVAAFAVGAVVVVVVAAGVTEMGCGVAAAGDWAEAVAADAANVPVRCGLADEISCLMG